jgi:hypothetical protein
MTCLALGKLLMSEARALVAGDQGMNPGKTGLAGKWQAGGLDICIDVCAAQNLRFEFFLFKRGF